MDQTESAVDRGNRRQAAVIAIQQGIQERLVGPDNRFGPTLALARQLGIRKQAVQRWWEVGIPGYRAKAVAELSGVQLDTVYDAVHQYVPTGGEKQE